MAPRTRSPSRRPPRAQSVSVGLVSRSALYCQPLADALSKRNGWCAVDLGSGDDDVIDRTVRLNPDVLVVDLPTTDTASLTEALLSRCPQSRVIAVLASESEREITLLAAAGVAGFIALEATVDELVREIGAALRDELECSPRLAAVLLRGMKRRSCGPGSAESAAPTSLTPREAQILRLIEDGLANKEIADRLSIHEGTVKVHVHRILTKQGVRHRWEVRSTDASRRAPLGVVRGVESRPKD